MKKIVLFTYLMLAVCTVYAMPQPYRSIKTLGLDEHNWFVNAEQLKSCMKDRKIETVIEVGSWLGGSTRFIAENCDRSAKIYAIDTWLGPSSSATAEERKMYESEAARLPTLFQQFLSNMKHYELTKRVIPIPMSSMEAALALKIQADLIYIDASHDEIDVFNDVMEWSKHLNTDGVICGNNWKVESVRVGVSNAASMLNKKINHEGNFWRLKNRCPYDYCLLK